MLGCMFLTDRHVADSGRRSSVSDSVQCCVMGISSERLVSHRWLQVALDMTAHCGHGVLQIHFGSFIIVTACACGHMRLVSSLTLYARVVTFRRACVAQ